MGGDARAEVSPVGMGPTPAAATPTKAIFNTKISVLNSRCGNKCNGVHALAEPRCPPDRGFGRRCVLDTGLWWLAMSGLRGEGGD